MIDTDEYIEMWNDNLLGSEGVNDLMNALITEFKRLREENKELEEFLNESHASNKIWHERLIRAQKWAYKQVCHNDSAMMDYDDYVWGEDE
tara:strand:- start:1260 stop:1532 length:273 start_codon:yes stop_codon:yes gene_type:complete